jgi:SAM-dependent methyltransferase
MDIVNELAPDKFADADDLLTFVSIYDDHKRLAGYQQMLLENEQNIKGQVCVDAGCGFGYLSETLVKLGAKKVYAIEVNPHLYQIAYDRLKNYPQVELIHKDLRYFTPAEPVAVMVHEFFGQMLYDEDLLMLDSLKFQPRLFLPDHAVLMAGCTHSNALVDETISPVVLSQLKGTLVSGLFYDQDVPLQFPVIDWSPGQFKSHCDFDISAYQGDLLYFGIQIFHQQKLICQSGICVNWSYVWTPRDGNVFTLDFLQEERGTEVYFYWRK